MALFKLIVNVTAASMTVVQSFLARGQLVGCSGSEEPCQVWRRGVALISSLSFSSLEEMGVGAFSTSKALRVGDDEAGDEAVRRASGWLGG